jgi:hypothetical protein
VGAILGISTTEPQTPKSGNEYNVDLAEIGKSIAALGFYHRTSETPLSMDDSEDGYPESTVFNPHRWMTNYPNPAIEYCTNRDGYWGRSNPVDQFRIQKDAITFEDLARGLASDLATTYAYRFYSDEEGIRKQGEVTTGETSRYRKILIPVNSGSVRFARNGMLNSGASRLR